MTSRLGTIIYNITMQIITEIWFILILYHGEKQYEYVTHVIFHLYYQLFSARMRRPNPNPKLHTSHSEFVSKLSRTLEMFTYSNSVLFQKNI